MAQASITNFFRDAGRKTARSAVDDAEGESAKRQRLLEVARPFQDRSVITVDDEAIKPQEVMLSSLPPTPAGEVEFLPLEGAPGALPPAWAAALDKELRGPTFMALRSFLRAEHARGTRIFPPAHEVFAAFHACDLDAVRVVIIGQDPYHDFGQAHGLAFSVKPGVQIPPSLRNMLKEVNNDPEVPNAPHPPHGCLQHWARQGVLLLNTCLTVKAHMANSHQKQGWEQFTDAVVRTLNQRCTGLVFLLWGLPAQKKGACVSSAKHTVIKSSHPSPLSAERAAAGCPAFMGSRCFSRCNEALLRSKRGPPIDWSLKL